MVIMGCSDKIPNISTDCEHFELNQKIQKRRFELYRDQWIDNVMDKLSFSKKDAEEAFIRIHKRV